MFKVLHRPGIFEAHIASAHDLPARYDYSRPGLGADLYLRVFLAACRFISFLPAILHLCLISGRLLKNPAYLSGKDLPRLRLLKSIWYVKVVRRIISVLLRTPFRRYMLKLVNDQIAFPHNSGCVIAVCHTPWKRLLVQWCVENDFALIISNGIWTGRKRRIQGQACGFSNMRQVVMHLHQKGKVIVTMDNFNDLDNCPVSFLGSCSNALMFPARLAKAAQVPLTMIIPALSDRSLNMITGPRFNLNSPDAGLPAVTRKLIQFLENEIRCNPGIWAPFIK